MKDFHLITPIQISTQLSRATRGPTGISFGRLLLRLVCVALAVGFVYALATCPV